MLNRPARFSPSLILIAALSASGVGPERLLAQSAAGQRFAVLVGINQYQHEQCKLVL